MSRSRLYRFPRFSVGIQVSMLTVGQAEFAKRARRKPIWPCQSSLRVVGNLHPDRVVVVNRHDTDARTRPARPWNERVHRHEELSHAPVILAIRSRAPPPRAAPCCDFARYLARFLALARFR